MDSVNFIKQNANNYVMHIVSGSDGNELRQICEGLQLAPYFKTINGSPTPKKELVRQVIEGNNYQKQSVVLIGDSINDYDATQVNDIDFIGYNNDDLKSIPIIYMESFPH